MNQNKRTIKMQKDKCKGKKMKPKTNKDKLIVKANFGQDRKVQREFDKNVEGLLKETKEIWTEDMMMTLVNRVPKELDLNLFESKAWITLLFYGELSPAEVAKAGIFPRSRSYDVLANLERKGFIVSKMAPVLKQIVGRPLKIRYEVLSIKQMLLNRIELIKKETRRKISAIQTLNLEEFKKLEVVK